IQVVSGRLPTGSRDADIAKEMIVRIDGLTSLVNDMLLFARPPQPHPARVDVVTLVAATVSLLAEDPAIGGVRIEVSGSAAPIMADADLLKIVFVNLLVNSAHAMHGEGVIRVAVQSSDDRCQVTFADS